MQLEVIDFVTRGCVTNIVLYHFQKPEAAAPAALAGAIVNPSHPWGVEIEANAKRTQASEKGRRIDISFISVQIVAKVGCVSESSIQCYCISKG